MLTLTLALLALGPQGPGSSTAPVVINEFMYDNWQNPDFREFVELYNRSGGSVDISGWRLDAEDWQGALANNQDFVVPEGTILNAGDYYVFGAEGGTVPNTDQVCVLDPGSNTGLWENGDEGLMIRDDQGTIIDVVYWESHEIETGGFVPPAYLIEGQGVWGSPNSMNTHPTSWSRLVDGYDTNNNGRDFRTMPQTPGTSNNFPLLMPYTVDTSGAVGSPVPQWGSSFDFARLVDPTVAAGNNPAAIPLSPAGSSKVFCLAPRASNGINSQGVGGGRAHVMLNTAPARDVIVEAWVYFDATPEASSYEAYSWALGVQGHSDGENVFPDIHPTHGDPDNGDCGITLTYIKDHNGATLYLIDHNDGGLDHTILGQVAIQQGVNDGWQRIRLQASARWAQAHIGGTYGEADGVVLSGPIQGHTGGVWVSHIVLRHQGTSSITQRPFTADALIVRTFDDGIAYLGSPTPSTIGSAGIYTSSYPHLGNQSFTIGGSGFLPNASVSWLLDFPPLLGPIGLDFVGAPAGAVMWAVPDTTLVDTSTAFGESSFPFDVASLPSWLGLQVRAQAFQLDMGLPDVLPVSHTRALEFTIVAF